MTTDIPVSRTKIVIPALRPEILHRPRLLALFDSLLDRKLIIMAAPAGYGKTSLLVDFARQSEVPVCWLSLDALDQDPQRFCVYLINALHQQFPRFGKQSSAVLKSLVSFEQDSERFLSTLINEIDARIDSHFILVVDDYQFVDAIPDIRNIFSRFIYLAGENCHIILSSRRLPTLPDITLMVARQQVSGFDLEELAFRSNEIRALFEINYKTTLEDGVVEKLMQKTEGWITGLHLSALRSANDLPDLTRASRAAGVDLAGYFDQQVLAPQPADLREFLLNTALLGEFNADLCEAVFGKGDWKNLIKTVRNDNLFVLPVGKGGKWLRYHHLFQEFLQRRIHEESPEKAQDILARLANVYQDNSEWEKAYAIYHQSNDPAHLADLIELAGTPLLLNERLFTLRTWLEELPARLLEARPALLSLKGALLCSLGEGRSALSVLNQAIAKIREKKDLPCLALALVRRAAANRLIGEYTHSVEDSDEALQLSRRKPGLQAIFAEATRTKGISLYHLGKMGEAAHFLEDALQYYEQLKDEQSALRVQTELGMVYRANGNHEAARLAYEQASARCRKESNPLLQANILNSMGILHHYQGDYEQAVRSFEAGLENARQSHSPWHEALLLTSLGDLYIDIEEYESASFAFSTAADIAQQISFQFLTNYLQIMQARLARLRGQIDKARVILTHAETFIRSSGSDYESGLFCLENGCVYLLKEETAAAVSELERALAHFQTGGLTLEAEASRIWLAAAHIDTGEVSAARAQLKTVINSASTEALPSPILQAFRMAYPWLAFLREDTQIGHPLVACLEQAVNMGTRLPALRRRLRRGLITVPIQVPQLTIQAFGKAHVWVRGKLVTTKQWKTASVRELFLFILAESHPLAKEEIGEVLWPELDAQRLKFRFKNEMYRLRHALGQDVILFDNNLYSFNKLWDYEYDVENFATLLAKAENTTQAEEQITYLRKAVSLREGAYLQDVDSTWVWPERERLDRICLDALRKLAEALRKFGDLQGAVDACQEALKINPYLEDIHYLAMQLHAERGDRMSVIWQYQTCRQALRSEMGIDPSEDLEILYKKLID